MRVLVVDDDKLVAVSLKTILEADGEITVVGLGEAGDDAIRLYREQHPDRAGWISACRECPDWMQLNAS